MGLVSGVCEGELEGMRGYERVCVRRDMYERV